jgi:hypothetical protein
MAVHAKISSFLGSIAGFFLSVFGRSVRRPDTNDLKKTEFKASTQRMGIRFTERIRDAFRIRWLKKR